MKINFNAFKLFMVSILLFSGTILLGQIDNLTNMSAEWIRLSNRNAAVDAVDIVVYNPAGLTKLADGFHFNISNQTLIRKPEHSFDLGMGKKTYTQDGIDPFIPNFYAAYKKDRWALFGGVYMPGGGAVIDYPQGSINTQLLELALIPLFPNNYGVYKNNLKATSLYLAFTIGGAYAFNDFIAIAGGLRYIDVKNTIKLVMDSGYDIGIIPPILTLDAKMTGDGVGGIIGIYISPLKGLNFGIHYESKVKLELETDIIKDSFYGMIISQGDKNRRDLPAMLGIGVSYHITSHLRAEADFNYFFQKQADWGITSAGELEKAILSAKAAGDCYSLGACLAYQVNPKLQLSGGFLYTVFDFKDMAGYFTNLGAFEVLYSDNCNLGAGFCYALTNKIKLNAGVSTTIWKDETIKALAAYPLDIDVQTANKTFVLALGANISL